MPSTMPAAGTASVNANRTPSGHAQSSPSGTSTIPARITPPESKYSTPTSNIEQDEHEAGDAEDAPVPLGGNGDDWRDRGLDPPPDDHEHEHDHRQHHQGESEDEGADVQRRVK